jgi:hypothetical protein
VKRCRTCAHVTAGDPTFCPSCGGSYDLRICSRGHSNSRSASACGECGARDLSNAQPRRRLSAAAGFVLLKVLGGSVLLTATVLFAVNFAIAIARDPTMLLGRMLIGLGLGLIWLALVFVA